MNTYEHYRGAAHSFRPTVSSVLWHYCHKDSAKHLLQPKKDIACRYVSFMKQDHSEVIAGYEAFVKHLQDSGKYNSIVDVVEDDLRTHSFSGRAVSPLVPLTFSFTENHNSQYHWEEYAKHNGFSFGFSLDKLDAACDNVIANEGVSLRLIPCFYLSTQDDSSAIRRIFDALMEDLQGAFDLLCRNKDDLDARKEIFAGIFTMCAGIKQGDFEKDKEWRLVMVAPYNYGLAPDEGFRNTGLRMYCTNEDVMNLIDIIAVSPYQPDLLQMLWRWQVKQRNRGLKICLV